MEQKNEHMQSEDPELGPQKAYLVKTDDGRTVRYGPGKMAPLGYLDLANSRVDGKIEYRCVISGITIGDTTGPFDRDGGQRLTLTMKLHTEYLLNVVGLVMGGWLPPIEAVTERVVLLDRNVVTEIKARFLGGKKRPTANPDAIDFLASERLHMSPMLFALEGNKRRFPAPIEVVSQYAEAVEKLRRAMPNARIEGLDQYREQRLLGMAAELQNFCRPSLAFLREAVPLLASPVPKSRRAAVWARILDIANKHRMRPGALHVIACLSAACTQNVNPARNLLKPRARYTDADAYNANADLIALELLLQSQQLFNVKATVLTADRNLALLWAGLGISKVEGRAFNMQLGSELFPGVPRAEIGGLASQFASPPTSRVRPIASAVRST